MASMIRFATTIKVGNPRLTRRCVRSSVEFYTSCLRFRSATLKFRRKFQFLARAFPGSRSPCQNYATAAAPRRTLPAYAFDQFSDFLRIKTHTSARPPVMGKFSARSRALKKDRKEETTIQYSSLHLFLCQRPADF